MAATKMNNYCVPSVTFMVKRRGALYRDHVNGSNIALKEKNIFRGGCRYVYRGANQGRPGKVAGIRRSLKPVEIMELKQDVAETLIVKVVMSVSE